MKTIRNLSLLLLGSFALMGCEKDMDSGAIYPPLLQSAYLYIYLSDENGNEPTTKGLDSFEEVRVDYVCDKTTLSNDEIFRKEGGRNCLARTWAYYAIEQGIPYLMTNINTYYYPNLPERAIRYFLQSSIKVCNTPYIDSPLKERKALMVPLNYFYDKNNETTQIVSWQSIGGNITSKDKIVCQWECEKSPIVNTCNSKIAFRYALRVTRVYVNGELKWSLDNHLKSYPIKEGKIVCNDYSDYTPNPYIELKR